MTETESTGRAQPAGGEQQDVLAAENDIEVRLGASLTHLPIVRSIAANLAVRADFDIDAISDLRLAVDEACSTLITSAENGSAMQCRFTIESDELRFHGTVPSSDREPPSTASFGWKVLTTLADSATTWLEPAADISPDGAAPGDAPDGTHGRVHVEVTKRKPTLT
ncbi:MULTISPECIES: ATP-binding protein [Prauserella salsuginis group]|uniref:Serine/threonine-protein kinase RsbW n=2 Tax=Prauserella salsuginis group TaxID=2893672 RepID=A0A839XP61_9PSEU|nr:MULTISPECIES: ATP-binding protein [Prauserella salsuginis group]MBB3662473.1 serine/threonine-protein kinase RsbW [Prauserella sediminis]